jgi:hypothetical protein
VAEASRRRVDDALLLQAASQLTDRDRYLCRLLLEHRVLTTGQVADVGFESIRRALFRLGQLRRLRMVDRFRPLATAGSAPYHWVLDTVGAAIVAAERGVEVDDLAWRRDKAIALAASERLGHAVGVNGFFTALLRTARHDPEAELVLWWSERRCAATWGGFARPDAYGVWAEAGRRTAFLFEHDNGTERLARLSDKLPGYARLFAAGGRRLWVLFSLPGPGREAEARRALRHPEVPVATAVARPGTSPAEAIWLPVGETQPRRRLVDLGDPSHRPASGAAPQTA